MADNVSRLRTFGEKSIQVGLKCSHIDPYESKAEEVLRRGRSIVTAEAKAAKKFPGLPEGARSSSP